MPTAEYTPTKPRIAFKVTKLERADGARYQLIDHDGRTWLGGYKSSIPTFEYNSTFGYSSGYYRNLATTEADAWLGIPDGYEIVPSTTLVVRIGIRFRDERRAYGRHIIMPDESKNLWEQLDGRQRWIVFQTFEGGYQSFDMADISNVDVMPVGKLIP